jgi:hypothetical protein
MPLPINSTPISPPLRDTVDAVPHEEANPPAIVSISDIHGYLEDARQALLTLWDHPDSSLLSPLAVIADYIGLTKTTCSCSMAISSAVGRTMRKYWSCDSGYYINE